MTPIYIETYRNGSIKKISARLLEIMESCVICPHRCNADRSALPEGICRTGLMPAVSSFHAHFGEEGPLVGRKGSGTIFFAKCNLSCIFCQNYDISALGRGSEVSYRELAEMMLSLQSGGCHNINFVTPTHVIYPIIKALEIAIPMGLKIPLVYNSGGYDSVDTIKLIKGIFDIYMPDLKYMDAEIGEKLSGAKNYPAEAAAAIKEMFNQVGDLKLNQNGIAYRGLLIRHLVLPNNIAATDRVISFIAGLSKNTYINIMDQYRPEFRAGEWFDLKRRITLDEYDAAINLAKQAGLFRIDSLMKSSF